MEWLSSGNLRVRYQPQLLLDPCLILPPPPSHQCSLWPPLSYRNFHLQGPLSRKREPCPNCRTEYGLGYKLLLTAAFQVCCPTQKLLQKSIHARIVNKSKDLAAQSILSPSGTSHGISRKGLQETTFVEKEKQPLKCQSS